jgi:putative hemolysin
MFRYLISGICLWMLIAACAGQGTFESATLESTLPATEDFATAVAALPNPASVFCEDNGYTLEIRQGEGGSYGVCLFPDGSECDEWAYFRGECRPGNSLAEPTRPGSVPAAVPTPVADTGWKTYHNEEPGYTVEYPASAGIEGADDPLQTVTFVGPLQDDDHWPIFNISHPRDREEFRPPEGVDLVQWLTDHYLLMAENQEPAAEVRQPDRAIAGTTAVHTRFERSPHSSAYDKYFFTNDGQLYTIVILHTGDKEDWDLYDRFLDSFQFD